MTSIDLSRETARHDRPSQEVVRAAPTPLGPEHLFWNLGGDKRFAFMFGSAFVLQVMHPEIGAAVGKESVFRTDPWGRSYRSLRSVQKWIFGGPHAVEEGKRLRKLHRTIRGIDDRGQTYDALDADAWAWVPLTAFHSLLVGHPVLYGRELEDDEQARLYEESLQICRILGVREDKLPRTVADYHLYFDEMVTKTLTDHPVAFELIDLFLTVPPMPGLSPLGQAMWPITRAIGANLHRQMVIGLLPGSAREILGLSWTPADDLALRASGRIIREIFERMPEEQRYFGIAAKAREAARAQQRLDDALAKI